MMSLIARFGAGMQALTIKNKEECRRRDRMKENEMLIEAIKKAEELTQKGVPEQIQWYQHNPDYCPRCGMKYCGRHK